MKKLVSFVCCMGIFALLAAGCGSKENKDNSGESEEIASFISATSENGYALNPINERETDGSLVVTCEVENSNDEFEVEYWVEDGHIKGIWVNAKTEKTVSSDNYKNCIAAMAKSFDKDIDMELFTEDIDNAINHPESASVSESIIIKLEDKKFSLLEYTETN